MKFGEFSYLFHSFQDGREHSVKRSLLIVAKVMMIVLNNFFSFLQDLRRCTKTFVIFQGMNSLTELLQFTQEFFILSDLPF